MWRSLGSVPGPDLDAYAVAVLVEGDPATVTRLLEELVDHSLLGVDTPGRYRLHDLMRAHARTLNAADPEPERAAARDRLLHYYAFAAQSASVLIARNPRSRPDGPAPAHLPGLTDPDAARTWLRTEQANLAAAFTHAHSHGLAEHAVNLAAGLSEILQADGPFARALEIHQTAAEAAENLDRPDAYAGALTDLGRVRFLAGDYPGADKIGATSACRPR